MGSFSLLSLAVVLPSTLDASEVPPHERLSLAHDLVPDLVTEATEAGAEAESEQVEPRVFYLFYADGTAPPSSNVCPGLPPVYNCSFGGSDGVLGCKRMVQAYLDQWYADFNIVFTLQRPTSGRYYTEVITNEGTWCGQDSSIAGISPFNCSDFNGNVCYAFRCGMSAKSCAVIIAQEQAHLVGLLHTSSANDVMFPSVCTNCNGFEDRENTASGSNCRATQNSYQLMKTRLGAWPAGTPKPGPFDCQDGAPPQVTVNEPAAGAQVPKDFTVSASVADDCGLRDVSIEVGSLQSTLAAPGPFAWNLGDMCGALTIRLSARDLVGRTSTITLQVTAPVCRGGGGSGGTGGRGGAAGIGGDALPEPDDGCSAAGRPAALPAVVALLALVLVVLARRPARARARRGPAPRR